MRILKEEWLSVTKKIKTESHVKELAAEFKARYYSSWHWAAIHLLTGIPEFQTPKTIADRLGIPLRKVVEIISVLENMHLLKRAGTRWVHASGDLHISRGSSLNILNHLNWRVRAVDQCNESHSLHYTNVFSASRQDAEVIKNLLLKSIEEQRTIIRGSKDEELFCFNCDFFSPM